MQGRAGSNLHTVSSKCLGAELVMKLLKNYCRNKGVKTSIRVGVVGLSPSMAVASSIVLYSCRSGYPNVGKSSVINSLKRKQTCNVGSVPGVTK